MHHYHIVKLGCPKLDWLRLSKGAAQGSVIGPFAYNVNCNDLMSQLRVCARYLTMLMKILSGVMV